MNRHGAIRALRVASLVLAVVGLVVLFLVWRRQSVPAAGSAAADPVATVRVDGIVARVVDGSGSGALMLWLEDGGGETLVVADSAQVEALLAGGHVPTVGDRVAVEGAVRGDDEFSYLALVQVLKIVALVPSNELPAAASTEPSPVASREPTLTVADEPPPTAASVSEPEIVERQLGDLSDADLGQTVNVQGILRSVQTFSAGVKGILDDGTGTVVLLLWEEVYEELSDPALLVPGAIVYVEGEVDEYQGELEIVPREPWGVLVTGRVEATREEKATPVATEALTATVPPPTALPSGARPLGDITAGDVGSILTIAQAEIDRVDYFSKGVMYELDDGSGRIVLLLWQNILEEVAARHSLVPGSQVRVRGEIDEYQGVLEIVPRSGRDIMVVDSGARPPVQQRQVGEITAADGGRILAVEGTVTGIEDRGWLWVWIDDGSGELLVFVPERVVDYLPSGIEPGVGLRVTGEVDVYKGQLEIIPLAGADVEVSY